MIGRKDCVLQATRHHIACRAILVFITSVSVGFQARAEEPPNPMMVSAARSLCKNVPERLVKVSMQPFPALMQFQTGYSCELSPPTDGLELGRRIASKEVQLGMMQGFEFAWAKQKYPELRPLVIAVNQHKNRQAHLIVRADSHVTSVSDLKGKSLAIPRFSRDHCRLFIDGQCREKGKPLDEFFPKVNDSMNAEQALDGLVEDTVQAVVMDDVAWQCYQRRKPGRSEQLKDFLQSEWFPDTVVAYRADFIDDAILHRFQQALLQSHETALGRQLLTLWFMTEFQKVPKDFDKLLTDTAKRYPSPKKLPTPQAN
jgi:ABC-type phosphate/phosphonate transport system substrate-binding protein